MAINLFKPKTSIDPGSELMRTSTLPLTIPAMLADARAKFGAKVTLIDEDTDEKLIYQIVGQDEADVKRGRLAITSPLARALIGKNVGETVEVNTPKGEKAYEIRRVKFG